MLTFNGIYNGQSIEFLDPVPKNKKYKVLVTFLEELSSQEENTIREFGINSNGFDFWNNEKEDIYQDFLINTK